MCMYILTYRGVYAEGVDEFDRGATARSLPDFIASMHLRFAARLTAWTKAGWRNASKILWSVIWCLELIVESMKCRWRFRGVFWMWSHSLPFIHPIGGYVITSMNVERRQWFAQNLPECSSWTDPLISCGPVSIVPWHRFWNWGYCNCRTMRENQVKRESRDV